MKVLSLTLVFGLAAPGLMADPSMREKITEVLTTSDQRPKPPPTAKEMTRSDKKDATLATPEAAVQLPDYEVVAPRTVIPNKAKIELDLAKNEVAARQEEAQLKATESDKALNHDKFSLDVGIATLAFGYDSAAERAAMARDRLKILDLEQTVMLTSLAGTAEDRKQLKRLLADLKSPTPGLHEAAVKVFGAFLSVIVWATAEAQRRTHRALGMGGGPTSVSAAIVQ